MTVSVDPLVDSTTVSSGVTIGEVRYLCLKNSMSEMLSALVCLLYTLKSRCCYIDVPKFHALIAWSDELIILSGFSCANTGQTKAVIGLCIKLLGPWKCA